MKPESASRRYFGITRAKGKMYELGLPEDSHIAVPETVEPAALFPLTIGTLVDASAALNDADDVESGLSQELFEDIGFSASFFDAYLASRFWEEVTREVTLLASAGYYIGRRPGSSLVLARRLQIDDEGDVLSRLALWVLRADWNGRPALDRRLFGGLLDELTERIIRHFNEGQPVGPITGLLQHFRQLAYSGGTAHEVVLAEVISAVIRMRLAGSAWVMLPVFTGLPQEEWARAIARPGFPKELWPSQKLLGQAGLFSGRSGVVQMPTSAGKTRSVEVILRSAFLSQRTRVAVVVAPFRALCHEIATSLRYAFKGEDVKVNELSDALQLDFADQLAELLGEAAPTTRYILALTPEKLLYVLRQTPSLVGYIGVVVYDEGHQFDTGPRGITYELLLTEIKGLLQSTAQTVLISAVIKNAEAVGKWLIGADPNVVNGTGLLSTSRSVAFATWLERLGQLYFFESDKFTRPDYFVPRVIEAQKLEKRPGERKPRVFPQSGDTAWKDVSLYLGIRLAPNGAVAIFCGRKDTASGLAERAVEIYDRGFGLPAPAAASDADEISRLVHLAQGHFGEESTIARAAALGIFVHHGTTPQGLRLSIEYAMQHELIKLVVCTSTLAQGVNLPIRYLIVSGINQGADRIKTRDFQNLIGRAGRAGMHTEGLILFADPRVIDRRRKESWRLSAAIELLRPENAEDTSSSLLLLVAPIVSSDGAHEIPVSPIDLLKIYFLQRPDLADWADQTAKRYPKSPFEARFLVREILKRRRLLAAVESYLMANRGIDSFEAFKARVRALATSTLAYALASPATKETLTQLFEVTADHIEGLSPQVERQAVFAKTLLGVDDAAAVEAWTRENASVLRTLSTSRDWLQAVWPLFQMVVDDKLLTGMEPEGLALQLAEAWMQGANYRALIDIAMNANGTKPWGERQRRALNGADVQEFLEGCLGFDCPLVLAAVGQFLFAGAGLASEEATELNLFQKSLKYGLPDRLSISSYEFGFADRLVSQDTSVALRNAGYVGAFFGPALTAHRDVVVGVLAAYPTYFSSVLESV